ncbi:hypothetical protein ACWOES_08280 [Dolosigranulum pigrum]|uniref:Uncharacterized protein n=1 Tax=Dolosigranulum pigrum TaxID=29394 RepID=A0A1S8KQI7_9LACT|nr:hypothetical protein BWX42_09990 [Dolosigranulum pigrum]
MYIKIIVALTTIIGTMAVYISQIPVRESMMPGGELFIPFYMLLFWMVGHDVYKGRKVDE